MTPRAWQISGWAREAVVKHYRVNKLAAPSGPVIKKKDILASSDAEAVRSARESGDCPICDVLSNGERVGAIR